MPDVNETFWNIIDAATAELTADDVRSLGPAVEWILQSGLVAETTSAGVVSCPECPDGHVEDVVSVPGDESTRLWIACPRLLRVQIDPEALRRWVIRWDALVAVLASSLGLTGAWREIDPGSVWLLGVTDWQQSRREVALAVGIGGSTSTRLGQHVGPAGRTIVLTTGALPASDTWSGRVPACVPVRDVLTIGTAGMALDAVLLADRVRAADEAARHIGGLTLDEDQLKDVIRRQVRAAQKKELTDDLMVNAVAIHGSARKAEKALKAEGYEVDHSTISRAVKRHKDAAAKIVRQEDSGSVSRTVASQPRNRGKKF